MLFSSDHGCGLASIRILWARLFVGDYPFFCYICAILFVRRHRSNLCWHPLVLMVSASPSVVLSRSLPFCLSLFPDVIVHAFRRWRRIIADITMRTHGDIKSSRFVHKWTLEIGVGHAQPGPLDF